MVATPLVAVVHVLLSRGGTSDSTLSLPLAQSVHPEGVAT
jgi:hypothetical protein